MSPQTHVPLSLRGAVVSPVMETTVAEVVMLLCCDSLVCLSLCLSLFRPDPFLCCGSLSLCCVGRGRFCCLRPAVVNFCCASFVVVRLCCLSPLLQIVPDACICYSGALLWSVSVVCVLLDRIYLCLRFALDSCLLCSYLGVLPYSAALSMCFY